jgi:hypothetical protein
MKSMYCASVHKVSPEEWTLLQTECIDFACQMHFNFWAALFLHFAMCMLNHLTVINAYGHDSITEVNCTNSEQSGLSPGIGNNAVSNRTWY